MASLHDNAAWDREGNWVLKNGSPPIPVPIFDYQQQATMLSA